uniref:Ubiquitin-like protease family profile domain-containing protein n=1 Tax=Anolis carolinensis TaxID=28377 RepID=A0A803TCA1_ANOCA
MYLYLFFLSHQVHFFNSFFYDKLRTKGYEGVKRWTKNVSWESEMMGHFNLWSWANKCSR